MEKPYVGAVKCDVSCEREDGRSILVKCWIIREDANNSRVVKVGLPRGDAYEAVVPNHLIQAKCFADGVKRVDAQIERSQSDAAIASRDEEPRATVRQPVAENTRRAPVSNGNGHKDDAATNKQLQYLLSIGKRMKLSTAALEGEVEQILGEQIGLYDLTKKQAGVVIDNLTTTTTAGSSRG